MRGFLTSAITLGLILSAPAYAADSSASTEAAPVIPTPLKVMPSKIKPVQTNSNDELSRAAPESDAVAAADNKALEILSPRPTYGFQNSFWADATRQDIATFLSSPTAITHSRTARDLSLKATLAPLASLPEPKKTDENQYALRLNKLVDLGSFEDAQKLYKLNESAPPTPLAAQAGIEASFGNAEIAVACLDQKTFDGALKATNAAFWSHVDTFCQALLSPVAGNDDELRLANASRAYIEIVKPTVSNVADINELDLITTIALLETGRLSAFIDTPEQLGQINDKHLAIMTAYAKPSAVNLPLLAEGLKRGIVSNDKAITFMKAIDLKDVSNPYNAFLKEYFKTPDNPALTDQLLALATDKTRETLLYPLFTAQSAIPSGHQMVSLRLLALNNQELPANLVLGAYGMPLNTPDESGDAASKSGEEILIKLLIEKSKSGAKTSNENGNPTLLALDYANYPQKGMKNAYDNLLSLTPNGNYVMPIGDILSSLKKSADKKQINQVVIRSLAVINDKSLEQLHPAALYQILEALNSAGLNEETMALTREVLASTIRN